MSKRREDDISTVLMALRLDIDDSVIHNVRIACGGKAGNRVEHLPLGARLGQCCGGSVTVLLECFVQPGLNLALFGAGHVAQALVAILGGFPGPVRWIDNRPDMVPKAVPANVQFSLEEDPVAIVDQLPANSQVLILTHNHALDFELVKAALQRKDCSYIGCIGSKAKAKRFQSRLLHQGYNQTLIAQLNCPVGHPAISGKRPMEVAVSIATSLIALINNNNMNQSTEIRSHGIDKHKQIVKKCANNIRIESIMIINTNEPIQKTVFQA